MPGRVSDTYSVDYRLNQLGIRVGSNTCQLISRIGDRWYPLGPRWQLPISVPASGQDLRVAMVLSVTAWQFCKEYPDTDLLEVLTGKARLGRYGVQGNTRARTRLPPKFAVAPKHLGDDPIAASRALIRGSRSLLDARSKETV